MVNRVAINIIRDVGVWLSRRAELDDDWLAGDDASYCLELLLEARENWLNSPDPTLWRTGDVHRLLIDAAAPRLTDLHGLREHGATLLRAYVDYLDETDRFHPASLRIAALTKEVDRAAAKYPAAMADESVWRLAKRIFTAMRAEGVDIADDAAVDAWAGAFSAAPVSRRRAVLGVLLDREPGLVSCRFVISDNQVAAIASGHAVPAALRRHDPDICDCLAVPTHPPISLPPIEDLAAAARESQLLDSMAACGRWVGSGRRVTKRGLPVPGDRQSLAVAIGGTNQAVVDHVGLVRSWRLALEVEVLRMHRTEVVAGPACATLEQALADDADPERVLSLWREIADLAVSGPTLPVIGDAAMSELDEFTRPWGPRVLGELYRLQDEVDLGDLIERLITDHPGPAIEGMLPVVVGAAVRLGLLAGAEAGAVVVTKAATPEIDPMHQHSAGLADGPSSAMLPIAGMRARLTPLGRYLVRHNLLAEGTRAPLLEPAS